MSMDELQIGAGTLRELTEDNIRCDCECCGMPLTESNSRVVGSAAGKTRVACKDLLGCVQRQIYIYEATQGKLVRGLLAKIRDRR